MENKYQEVLAFFMELATKQEHKLLQQLTLELVNWYNTPIKEKESAFNDVLELCETLKTKRAAKKNVKS